MKRKADKDTLLEAISDKSTNCRFSLNFSIKKIIFSYVFHTNAGFKGNVFNKNHH